MSIEYSRMRHLAMVVVLAACSTRPNPKNCLDNHCNDPALPFCDVDGAIGGEPNTCIAVDCMPLRFEECRGDRALVCNAAGDNFDLVACEFGCDDTGCKPCTGAGCEKHIIPRFIPNACTNPALLPELTISADTTIDTSNELACSEVVKQPTGPEICVLHYDRIKIEQNRTYTVTGKRALALVADHLLLVEGILDGSATGKNNGPAGGLIKSGTGGNNGGGGAGYRTAGGSGASASVDGGGANGGAAGASPLSLAELFGGRQPTKGPSDTEPGGAGGALVLTSCRGEVSITGLIDVNGGGGQGGLQEFGGANQYFFATGGGSGGTVVLQGQQVTVTGQIFANGGGGGGGGGLGMAGQDGQRATTAALGGTPAPTSARGNGGTGGTASAPANGQFVTGETSTGGAGGGGSAGFIITLTPDLVFPTLTPLAVSPGFESKGTVPTN